MTSDLALLMCSDGQIMLLQLMPFLAPSIDTLHDMISDGRVQSGRRYDNQEPANASEVAIYGIYRFCWLQHWGGASTTLFACMGTGTKIPLNTIGEHFLKWETETEIETASWLVADRHDVKQFKASETSIHTRHSPDMLHT